MIVVVVCIYERSEVKMDGFMLGEGWVKAAVVATLVASGASFETEMVVVVEIVRCRDEVNWR